MAESESGADKSEEPTSKRLEESRKKGQIARSRELNTVVVTMAGIGGLLVYGADFGQTLLELMRGNFALSRDVLLDDRSMALYLLASGKVATTAQAQEVHAFIRDLLTKLAELAIAKQNAREHRTDQEADRGRPLEEHADQHEQHRAGDGDSGVLAVEVGARAFLDGAGDLAHALVAGRLLVDPASGPQAIGDGDDGADKRQK